MSHPVTAAKLPPSERDDASAFWSGHGIRRSYTRDQHWRGFMARKVLAGEIKEGQTAVVEAGRDGLAIRAA